VIPNEFKKIVVLSNLANQFIFIRFIFPTFSVEFTSSTTELIVVAQKLLILAVKLKT